MKYSKILLLLIAIVISTVRVEANSLDNIIYKQDIQAMLVYANANQSDEQAIADAFCSIIDLNRYGYEQLKSWTGYSKTPIISEMLQSALHQKELDILREIQPLTVEQLASYMAQFPDRRELVKSYLTNVVMPNLKDLSLEELIYLDACLPKDYHYEISVEINRRSDEVSNTLNAHSKEHQSYEKQLAVRLKYNLEEIVWNYFVEGHKQLYNAYSRISMVSDIPGVSADQYQRLVNACFPTEMMRETLQKEVDQFSVEINKARKEYYKAMGKNKYPQFSYKIPILVYDSSVSWEPLYKIANARQKYIEDRSNVSTGTSVLGWLFGPAVGLISKGIGDMFAVDGLVDNEFNARKEYMESVQQKLRDQFASYSETITSGIDKSL